MKIRYLGHAAFELNLESGKRIIFDPYESGAYDGALGYGPITGTYDLAVVSHDHADHNCKEVTEKAGKVVESAGEFEHEGIKVHTYPTYHDETQGSERGTNLIAVIETEGMRIAHLGDLGHAIDISEMPELEGVDVVFVPVGGHFTVDAETATGVVETIGPRCVIPMHFKTEKVGFPITPVDNFLALAEHVERAGGSEFTVSRDNLPETCTVVVLDPAL